MEAERRKEEIEPDLCLTHSQQKKKRVALPDIEAQQQGDEDTWDDDVTETQHGKVTGFKSFLQQVLRKDHWRRERKPRLYFPL